jgi:hypothetical protein
MARLPELVVPPEPGFCPVDPDVCSLVVTPPVVPPVSPVEPAVVALVSVPELAAVVVPPKGGSPFDSGTPDPLQASVAISGVSAMVVRVVRLPK